jgi:hypothetical protein
LQNSFRNIGNTKLLIQNFSFKEKSYYFYLKNFFSEFESRLFNDSNDKIELLFTLFKFDSKYFFDFLSQEKTFYLKNIHYNNFGKDNFNFLCFLRKYDHDNYFLNNLYFFESFLSPMTKIEYNKELKLINIKNKIKDF